MTAVIYSIPNCPWCDKAKQVFNERNIEYIEYIVNVDITKDELLEKIPKKLDRLTAPQIWIDTMYVGGYDNLVSFLELA